MRYFEKLVCKIEQISSYAKIDKFVAWTVFFLEREFQSMTFALNNSALSLDQDISRFLV